MNSLDQDPRLRAVLDRLHTQSAAQEEAMRSEFAGQGFKGTVSTKPELQDEFWRDQLVALEPDKARYCYALCRALNARRIVEAGTSFGVSTLYLAAAIRDNGGGSVIGGTLDFRANAGTLSAKAWGKMPGTPVTC